MKHQLKLGLICSVAAVCLLATPAAAQRRAFNVPANDAVKTIPEFAKQANLQIIAPADRLGGVRTRALDGEMDARAALMQLLRGTGLEVASDDGAVVTLRQMSTKPRLIRLAATQPVSAPAQAAPEPVTALQPAEVEELIVTARKVSENIQDVPLTITALTEKQMARSGVVGLRDLAALTPGLTVQDTNGSYTAPTIRGLALANQPSLVGNVAVFLDGLYLNNRAGLEFDNLDVARIEVVKGPQSALYGRNAYAGAINYVTRAPELGRFSGALAAEAGTHDRYMTKGSLNIPLGDRAAMRVFGGWSKFDGTVKNVRDGQYLGGYKKKQAYGGSLLFEPTENLSIKIYGAHSNTDLDPTALVATPISANNCGSTTVRLGVTYRTLLCGRYPVPTTVDVDGTTGFGLRGKSDIAYLVAAYEFPAATLTGTVGYEKASYAMLTDITADPNAINQVAAGTFSRQVYLNAVTDRSNETSYDLRLASRDGERLSWSLGTYYFDSTVGSVLNLARQTVGQPNSPAVDYVATGGLQEAKSYSVYGSAGYDLTERLTVAAEVRYSHEEQTFHGRGAQAIVAGAATYNYVTPRFTLNYKVAPQVMAYASAARGLKTGGFNSNAFNTARFAFKPETNWTYELGVKATLFDGKLIANGDVFYADLKGIQGGVNIPGQTIQAVTNEGGARSYGVEADLAYFVTDNLVLRAAASAINPEYKSGFQDGDLSAACGNYIGTTISTVGCSDIVTGKQLARTSRYQAALSANWTIPKMVGGFDGFLRGDYSYQSSKDSTGCDCAEQGSIDLANARFGVTDGKLEIAVWSKNLFDKKYLDRGTVVASTNDGAPATGITYVRIYPGERRTFGVRLDYRF